MKNLVALVLALVIVAAAVPSAAVDSCLKQGEFALALAVRVHLSAANEAEAVKSLSDMGVKPDDGWKTAVFLDEKSFNEIDRAVIVAFADGKLAGNPSAARAVLAGATMPDSCHDSYFATSAAVSTPDMMVMPLPLEKGDSAALRRPDVPRQQNNPPESETAALPIPVVGEARPGIEDPEPGKKQPVPISPFEPWDGPTRPGPGRKEPAQ